jgi:hypothetical protein
MTTHDSTPHQPQRATTTVRDRDVAAQIVVDLTERGIAPERVTTRPLDPGRGLESARQTGEDDLEFTESVGKSLGAGFVIAFLIGAVVGAIGVSLLFEPPWASPLAAGITLAVAIGVGWFAGALGFLQAGIAKTGETGGRQMTATRPAHREDDRGMPAQSSPTDAPGKRVEVIVEAATPEEAETARSVFEAHNAG